MNKYQKEIVKRIKRWELKHKYVSNNGYRQTRKFARWLRKQ